MNMLKPDQSIRNRLLVARLPAMPQILSKLLDLCQRDKAGMGEIAKLIAHDAGMTAKIMSVANSSAYNRTSQKIELLQSLNTLGLEIIKTLIISESVFQTFSSFSSVKGTDLHGFWVHSLKAAVLAREIAKKINYPHSEEAYLAGLLHDVGRLVLLSVASQEYSPNFVAQDDERLCFMEASSVGMAHPEIGAWLIERWNLDSFMADSVLYHHEPIARLKSAHPLIRIVCLAHLLSCYKSDSPALEDAGALCGIDSKALGAILAAATTQTRTAAAYFGIDLTDADQAPPSAEYQPASQLGSRPETRLADEIRDMALVSAASQSFSRIRDGNRLLEFITRTARILFNLDDMVVLLHNANTQVLSGVPVGNRQRRLAEFSIPLGGGDIIAGAVLKQQVTFVDRNDTLLGVAEEQLLRIMGTECLVCLPLTDGQSCFGVLVGGLSSSQAAELWGHERFLQSFATQAASALTSSTATRNEIEKHIASANEAHRQASRKVVHEVNNPLSIIKNYLSVLDDKLSMHEPITEELNILNEEIDRISRIVGEFAESQTAPQAPITQETRSGQPEEMVEINGVLNDVVRLFSISRFLPTSVSIAIKTADQSTEMIDCADTLRQILLNLIKNAVEALPKGGRIEISNNGRIIRDGRPYIELHISDTGTGIPAHVLDKLFLPVQSSKKGENRGLGLSVVHDLVKKINGYISCHSKNTGTTFEILLPVSTPAKRSNESARIANTV